VRRAALSRTGTLLSALAIVAMLGVALLVRTPTSGVDVRVLRDGEPFPALIRVAKPGRREILASARPGRDGRARFSLDPGRYLLKPQRRTRGAVPVRLNVAVVVRRNAYAAATVRYRDR